MSVVIIEVIIGLISGGSKLSSNLILFRLRDAVDKVLREEHCSFRKGGGFFRPNFHSYVYN